MQAQFWEVSSAARVKLGSVSEAWYNFVLKVKIDEKLLPYLFPFFDLSVTTRYGQKRDYFGILSFNIDHKTLHTLCDMAYDVHVSRLVLLGYTKGFLHDNELLWENNQSERVVVTSKINRMKICANTPGNFFAKSTKHMANYDELLAAVGRNNTSECTFQHSKSACED